MRGPLIFRQLFEKSSSSYSYILGCGVTKKALIIDAVLEESARDIQLLRELDLDLQYSLNTHMHADHVRSCQELRKAFPKLQSVHGDKNGQCDIMIADNDVFECGKNVHLKCLYTPGHTDGCYSFFFNHENHPMVFTGDAMLIRRCGRTDFQNGCANDLYDSIQNKLYHLPIECTVFPGHDYNGHTMSSIEEEKKFNIRCPENQTREKFKEIMNNLGLAPPKNIEYNVTENRKRG
mmetsp:Transcript_59445/g.98131  ORF Transcript_59445/g.98131 Transcript_59445/m.98131 type:complete len:235 (-) Transcript_59445:158-862(-)